MAFTDELGTEYLLCEGARIREDPARRQSFTALAEKAFGLDFEKWLLSGYLGARYRPYTLLDGGKAAANISVNDLEFLVDGEPKRFALLGSVMTDPAYRRRGLIRLLMEHILREWTGRCDMLYLFANHTVMDFYPRFGFARAEQFCWSGPLQPGRPSAAFRRLDPGRQEDLRLYARTAEYGNPFSKLVMRNNLPLLLLNSTEEFARNLYYSEALDAAAVFRREPERVVLEDVFCREGVSLTDVLRAASGGEKSRAVLHFPPRDDVGYEREPLPEHDAALFVLGRDARAFTARQWMFPPLTHA